MGGLPCAKAVIDNGYALTQKLACMSASIMLNAGNTQPSYEQMDEFIRRANYLAEYAAEIQSYVSGDGKEGEEGGEEDYKNQTKTHEKEST